MLHLVSVFCLFFFFYQYGQIKNNYILRMLMEVNYRLKGKRQERKKRFMKVVKDDLKMVGVMEEDAVDRER